MNDAFQCKSQNFSYKKAIFGAYLKMVNLVKNIKRIISLILPDRYDLPLRMLWRSLTARHEPEMIYVQNLLSAKRRFIDIGGNIGAYSYFFSRKFQIVECFEPLKEIPRSLSCLNKKNINIHNVALSNRVGKLKFYIPIINGKIVSTLASLEKRNCEAQERIVEINTLDNYKFEGVDLIKIDVEGHEFSVIEGAKQTILRDKPVLIIEIEQRHNESPISMTFELLDELDYVGFFLFDDRPREIKFFNVKEHQLPYANDELSKKYINNFIFIHSRDTIALKIIQDQM